MSMSSSTPPVSFTSSFPVAPTCGCWRPAGSPERAVAAAVLFDATATWAGLVLAGLLVAMFPANVRASSHHLSIGGRPATPVGPRAVMQAVFLAAAVAVGL